MRRKAILVIMMGTLAAATWPSPAQSEHTACPVSAASASTSGLTDVHVASTLSNLVTETGQTVCSGTLFFSEAASCPTPPQDIVPVSGAYCGPVVQNDAEITCRWLSVRTTVPTRLFMGFDWNGNG